MRSGDYTLGNWVTKFETSIGAAYNVRHCVGVNSGTDALVLAMRALGIRDGATVLTAPNTFPATVGAILALRARPFFVDVGADYQLDYDQAVHRRVSAAIPVHLTGLARYYQAIWPLVINDAAQAIGAEWAGVSVTNFAHVSCFSLHPLKNVHGAGDGGFITTNDDALAKELRLLRNHGLLSRDYVGLAGYNSRLDSIQAIFAWHNLKLVDEINNKRRETARRYDEAFNSAFYVRDPDNPAARKYFLVQLPPRPTQATQVFHTYVIQVDQRSDLIKFLGARGIEAKIHYPVPCHLQPGFSFLGYKRGDFPVCESQADRILSLPIHEYLTDDQIDWVIESVIAFYRDR